MVYILLTNGSGVLLEEASNIETRISISFTDCPSKCHLLITNGDRFVKCAVTNGTSTVDLTDLSGDVDLTLISEGKRWVLDPIRVGKTLDGKVYYAARRGYGEKLAALLKANVILEKRITSLEQKLTAIENRFEYSKDGYSII